jgi:lipopolysaccharide/colanic/teichoic acid biosynthesis glycosyltransferase
VRRSVSWSRIDRLKLHGFVRQAGDAAREAELVAALVERWPTPDQSLEGIEQAFSGVWHLTGEPPPDDRVCIGPLWLGPADRDRLPDCLVGPEWVADQAAADQAADQAGEAPGRGAQLRPLSQVTLPEIDAARGGGGSDQAYPLLKRALDVAVSAASLLLLLPVFLLVALLIVLEDGRPVFFGHRRQGRGGRSFRCWKFRTMHPNAEQIARDLEAYNVCDGPQVFIKDDPRVTRIGRTLRRTHVDELPQLWNVLAGHMSLVGPRPSPDDENQLCPAWRDARLSVRPGITGLWQLNRTREPGEDFQEWIKYDLEYVQRASMWLDIGIVLGGGDRATE